MKKDITQITTRYYDAVKQCQFAKQLEYPFSADHEFINNEYKEARAALYEVLAETTVRRKPLIDVNANKNILDVWEGLIFHLTLSKDDEHRANLLIDYNSIKAALCKAIGLPKP